MADTSGEQRGDGRAGAAGPPTVAEKLDHLLQAHGTPSLEKVAQAILERGGPTVSASYLWLLRTGKKDNPTLKHVTALATYFGVPPAYFFDDALTEQDEADPELVVALRGPGIRALAVRAAGLSPLGQRALVTLAEQLEQIEAQAGEA